MSIFRLERFFHPKSIAVIGASQAAGTVGRAVLTNLVEGGFSGRLALVNPKYAEIDGRPCLPSVTALDFAPELAVVATPAAEIEAVLQHLGQLGTQAVILCADSKREGPEQTAAQLARLAALARRYRMRILGPDSFGLFAPHAQAFPAYAATRPAPGDIALITQSGTMMSTICAWAEAHGNGLSGAVSVGSAIDVDLGDALDYFALDPRTKTILLVFDQLTEARKFLSAARAASLTKPVIAMHVGRHRGTVVNGVSDERVYEAALKRAGVLTVDSLGALFDAAETLSNVKPFVGGRLAVITNGLAPGILALDRLYDLDGTPAVLGAGTIAKLGAMLPNRWTAGNPVDLVCDADGERYARAFAAVIDDPGVDAVLAVHAPTALGQSRGCAEGLIAAVEAYRKRVVPAKPVFATWFGDQSVADLFTAAHIALHDMPSGAVTGFMHVVRYVEGRDAAMQAIQPDPVERDIDPRPARAIVSAALARGETRLGEYVARSLVASYHLPGADSAMAPPVGGDTLDLAIVVSEHPLFGPVVTLRRGGKVGSVLRDRAVALPPLDRSVARALLADTRAGALIAAKGRHAIDAVVSALIATGQLLADLPELRGLEIECRIDAEGALHVTSAGAEIAPLGKASGSAGGHPRFAIRPYPRDWERDETLADGTAVEIRPLRPQDEAIYAAYLKSISPEDLRLRFFSPVKEFTRAFIARMLHLDYARSMAFCAIAKESGQMLGIVRLHADPDHETGEYAILVRSSEKGKGLGLALMQRMIDYARADGLRYVKGQVLTENRAMLAMCARLGFRIENDADDVDIRLVSLTIDNGRPLAAE